MNIHSGTYMWSIYDPEQISLEESPEKVDLPPKCIRGTFNNDQASIFLLVKHQMDENGFSPLVGPFSEKIHAVTDDGVTYLVEQSHHHPDAFEIRFKIKDGEIISNYGELDYRKNDIVVVVPHSEHLIQWTLKTSTYYHNLYHLDTDHSIITKKIKQEKILIYALQNKATVFYIQYLFELYPDMDVNCLYACLNDIQIFNYLISKGANPHWTDARGNGLFYYLFVIFNFERNIVVSRLHELEVNCNHQNVDGCTFLHYVNDFLMNELQNLTRLAQLDLNILNNTGMTPLMGQIFNKNSMVAQRLILLGADCNLGYAGHRPIYWAMYHRLWALTALIVKKYPTTEPYSYPSSFLIDVITTNLDQKSILHCLRHLVFTGNRISSEYKYKNRTYSIYQWLVRHDAKRRMDRVFVLATRYPRPSAIYVVCGNSDLIRQIIQWEC